MITGGYAGIMKGNPRTRKFQPGSMENRMDEHRDDGVEIAVIWGIQAFILKKRMLVLVLDGPPNQQAMTARDDGNCDSAAPTSKSSIALSMLIPHVMA